MALYIVYAKFDNAQVWSDTGKIHKAGRVPLGERLTVLSVTSGWYKIERPVHINLPVQPLYPNYFIDPALCQAEPIGEEPIPVPVPAPEPTTVNDLAAGAAVVTFLRWLRELFR